MLKSGETPGKGEYVCKDCKEKVILDDRTDKLPPCPKCDNPTNYTKL